MSGQVVGIFIAAKGKETLHEIEEAEVVVGKGLTGDRYALGQGSFSRWPGPGREVTLIEAEVIADVLRTTGIDLAGGRSRRNLVTTGVRLLDLMNVRFRIGEVIFHGDRPADPCRPLERLLGEGLMTALAGRGGLRATVITGGIIRKGDQIEALTTPTGK